MSITQQMLSFLFTTLNPSAYIISLEYLIAHLMFEDESRLMTTKPSPTYSNMIFAQYQSLLFLLSIQCSSLLPTPIFQQIFYRNRTPSYFAYQNGSPIWLQTLRKHSPSTEDWQQTIYLPFYKEHYKFTSEKIYSSLHPISSKSFQFYIILAKKILSLPACWFYLCRVKQKETGQGTQTVQNLNQDFRDVYLQKQELQVGLIFATSMTSKFLMNSTSQSLIDYPSSHIQILQLSLWSKAPGIFTNLTILYLRFSAYSVQQSTKGQVWFMRIPSQVYCLREPQRIGKLFLFDSTSFSQTLSWDSKSKFSGIMQQRQGATVKVVRTQWAYPDSIFSYPFFIFAQAFSNSSIQSNPFQALQKAVRF